MRWIANIISVLLTLAILSILIYNSIDYEFITGFPVLDPLYAPCGTPNFYENFWNRLLNEPYTNVVVNYYGPDYGGNCNGFELYRLVSGNGYVDLHFIYVFDAPNIQDVGPMVLAGFARIDNSSGTWSMPSNLQDRTNIYRGSANVYAGRGTMPLVPNEAQRYLKVNFDINIPWINTIYFNNEAFGYEENLTAGNTRKVMDVWVTKNVNYTLYQYVPLQFVPQYPVTFNGVIPNFTLNEDNNISNAFNLANYFNGSNLQYTFYTNMSNSVDFIVQGTQVTISPRNNWYGNVTANISTSNGSGFAFSNNFYIRVNPINDSPVLIQQFEQKYVWQFNQNKTFEISDYFSDPDGDRLTFGFSGLQNIGAIVTPIKIIFIPQTNWKGNESVVITANDSVFSVSTRSIILIVRDLRQISGNTAPSIIGANPNASIVSMTVGENKEFSVVARDEQNDTLTYNWTVNGKQAALNFGSYTFVADSVGSYLLKVLVSDNYYTRDMQWEITVSLRSDQNLSDGIEKNETEVEVSLRKRVGMNKIIWLLVGLAVILLIIIGVIYFLGLFKKGKQEVTIVKSSSEKDAEKKEIVKHQTIEPRKSYFETLTYDELTGIVNFIKKYKVKGISDTKIKEVLLNKGWKIEQINEAFKRAEI